MSSDSMSLRARVNNYAKRCRLRPQAVLQAVMFERVLQRLSLSRYREQFILKGGAVISIMLGVSLRTTMDIDTTIRGIPMNEASLLSIVREICAISLDDGVQFTDFAAAPIRKDDIYGGFRVRFVARYGSIATPLSIDISTGDMITPGPVQMEWHALLDDSVSFILPCYNLETILAEKVETILRRLEFNTRPRDFYDVFALCRNFTPDMQVFRKALYSTARHRGSEQPIQDFRAGLERIAASADILKRWQSYAREYPYARNITLEETLQVITRLMESISVLSST